MIGVRERVEPAVLPAAASVAVAGVVAGTARPVRVLAAFPAAVYLAHDDGVLAVVAADGVAHPNAVVLAAPAARAGLARWRPSAVGLAGDHQVALADQVVRVTRWFDPRPRPRPVAPDVLAARTAAATAHLTRATGPAPAGLAAPLADALTALTAHEPAAVVAAGRRLLGLGPGLTPAGDDVIAGLCAGVAVLAPVAGADRALADVARAAGDQLARAAVDATTAVSAALLGHAVRGEVAAPVTGLLRALADDGDPAAAVDRLLRVGSTSGRDLALGVLAAAGLVAAEAGPGPSPAPVPAPVPHRAAGVPAVRPSDTDRGHR